MKKLLPDMPPIPPGMDVPKTLVLNLSGTLIHTEFVVKIEKSKNIVKIM